jgi:hypothetical protein
VCVCLYVGAFVCVCVLVPVPVRLPRVRASVRDASDLPHVCVVGGAASAKLKSYQPKEAKDSNWVNVMEESGAKPQYSVRHRH